MSRAASAVALGLAVLAAAPPVSGQAKSSEELAIKQAIRLIYGGRRGEAEVRSGAQQLLKVNSVNAIEVLLKVLNDSQPHYRDIAWEVLPDFTDPYAKKRVEHELKSNRGDELVREWCAELLGHYRDSGFAASLMVALNDSALGVRRAAARSLGQLGHEPAFAPLGKLVDSRDAFLRELALEATARIHADRAKARYLEGLGDADGGVRCALLGALPGLYPDLAEPRSIAALQDADWRPRLQAVENLGSVKSHSAIEALLRALEDGRPVVAERARRALQGLTGQSLTMPQQWRQWWSENRATFDFARTSSRPSTAAQKGGTVSTYHGIDATSDHIAFLLDRSPDMDQRLKSKSSTKEEAALAELDAVLQALQGRLVFNVFAYCDEIKAFHPKPVPLDKKSAAQAVAFVKQTRMTGGKNIWHALETVVSDPTIDTVFLLSSGEPEVRALEPRHRASEGDQSLPQGRGAHDLVRGQQVVPRAAREDRRGDRGQVQGAGVSDP